MRVLRVSEIKPPSRNALLVALFALESQKGSRNDERTLFWDSSRSLDLSFKPLAPERRHLAVSRTTFVLAIFWQLPVVFRKKDQIH